MGKVLFIKVLYKLVLVRPSGGAHPVWVLMPQCSDRDTILSKKHHPSDETLNRGPDSLWSLKIPGCLSKRVEVWPRHPGQICPLASDHHGLLIIPIHWLASSLCLLSTNKLVCGGRSGALWLPSHHPGGCCTLVVDEKTPPSQCRALWVLRKAEKRYINVINYYYYYYYFFFFRNKLKIIWKKSDLWDINSELRKKSEF